MAKRVKLVDDRSLRNLAQYRDLTDEEFEEKMIERRATVKKTKVTNSKSISQRAEEKLKEFEVDYDLTDLKYNDKEALTSLVNATIMLEDFEKQIHNIQQGGVDLNNLTLIDKLNRMASDLRSDIIKYQDSLMITRKIRKSGKEEDLLNYLDDLKMKALEFYESRMNYIYCPKCKMLLSTAWFLYPDANNKIRLTCKRTLDNGEYCDNEFVVSTEELIKKRNKNIEGVPTF